MQKAFSVISNTFKEQKLQKLFRQLAEDFKRGLLRKLFAALRSNVHLHQRIRQVKEKSARK